MMDSNEIRKNFLNFFKKNNHKIVSSSSLIPTDTSVLFTTAGMQQFKNYYLVENSPFGPNTASCQKCFRTSDIEEVGDERHLTFFEMLGNFSFGGYFKEETINFAFEFLTKNCKIKKEKLWITIFKGDSKIPVDTSSFKIWQKLGIPKSKIFRFGKNDNFWGPTGIEGPCGPTTEIHYELKKGACKKGKNCLPNCECGRFIEVWNLVFNEYYQNQMGELVPLKQKGVDTGMGLERLAMVVQKKNNVFETDLFLPLIKEITDCHSKTENIKAKRIIVDHIKGAVFLISEEILPSNVERGYVLRRILRRAIRYEIILDLPENFLINLAKKVILIYGKVYPEIKLKENEIFTVIQNEDEKFKKTIQEGLRKFDNIIKSYIKKAKKSGLKINIIGGKDIFDLYQSYGFPLEMTEELAKERNFQIDKEGFFLAQKKHQEISKVGAQKKFGGIGKEATYEAIKLHTATHLLHAALRRVLGEKVKQMGSDINSQRLRFDFSFERKMTEEEIRKIEDLINQKIKEDLNVKKEEKSLKEALKEGALAFFKEKYPEIVTIYSVGNFSKEICAGPHVKKTSELGYFKIIKEESCGAGIRRIRAILKKY